MKIRVCIPFYSEFEATKPGIAELLACNNHEFVIEPRQSSVVGRTRNSLINDEKNDMMYQKPVGDFDYYLMVDSDISFTLNDVLTLMSHGVEVCCAPYTRHDKEGIYDCGMFYPNIPGANAGFFKTDETGFKAIDWAGAGFMLFKASVFPRFEYPWYRHNLVRVRYRQKETSEDVGLAMNLRNHGIKLFCDFDVKIGHRKREQSDFDWSVEEKKNLPKVSNELPVKGSENERSKTEQG